MIEPTEADIGRRVIYTGGEKPERGVITKITTSFVFVRYNDEAHSKGTRRQDLEWPDGTGNESPETREAA